MEAHDPQPPNPALDEEWEPYKRLIEEDMIPDYGIQIFTYVDTQGRRGYKWMGVGDSTIEEIVMMLTRCSFLMQFRSEIIDLGGMAPGEDEEE